MDIYIHIGLPHCGVERIQDTLAGKRARLEEQRVLFPRKPGRKNHSRLFMAVTDADNIDPLRASRGLISAEAQEDLRQILQADLKREVEAAAPDKLILSAGQIAGGLTRTSELERLRDLVSTGDDRFHIIMHVDEQARLLTRAYADQLLSGRLGSLDQELDIVRAGKPWVGSCLAMWPKPDADRSQLGEIQAPPFWLDYTALIAHWESVFGKGSVVLRPFDPALFDSDDITREVCAAFDLEGQIGHADFGEESDSISAATLTRIRLINGGIDVLLKQGKLAPRQLRKRLAQALEVPGDPLNPGSLHEISTFFAADNAALVERFPDIAAALTPDAPADTWQEAAPDMGFRVSQYMAAFLGKIDRTTRQEIRARKEAAEPRRAKAGEDGGTGRPAKQKMSAAAEDLLPEEAKVNFRKLAGGPFAPHNNIGRVNEEDLAAPFDPVPPRDLPKGRGGNLIVGCMKNEGPYILEWVAYHRAIGFDNFLIYTNGCEDGTDAILKRLQDMGIAQHRDNDEWKGKSPQQHALNQSLKEDVLKTADWIAHIDVDEFINIRCGNGTVQDLLDHVDDATNIAMTWRLFGHSGVQEFRDDLVISQFDACAPKFCPKPHTVWGFKTMFRNIGAYQKISCHRPNKLQDDFRDKVKWVNGSGEVIEKDLLDNGWRSSKKSIGYDLVQLNHYALRSAESFLIKRQRGRALHVDRSIGLNYWVRMDWSDYRDVTIQRNIPRTKAEMARLLQDDTLRELHENAVAWHRAKAADLKKNAEFKDLYDSALSTRLNEMERVAYALALEVDS